MTAMLYLRVQGSSRPVSGVPMACWCSKRGVRGRAEAQKKKKKKTDRTSRQTQAGIGHNVEEFTRTHSTSSQAGHPDCWRRPDHDCASYMYTESTPPSRSGGDSSNLSPPAPPSPLPCVRPQYRLLPLRFASSSLPYMLDVVAFPQQEPL